MTQNPKSKVQNLLIRPLHPNDIEDLYAIVSHPTVARTLVQLPSMEYIETEEWIGKKQPGRHRLVVEIEGRVVASGSITQYQNPRMSHSGVFGLMVHPDYWGKGVGNTLTAALLDLADNWLNLKRVELQVYTHHTPAVRLYEKHGFTIEATARATVFGEGRYFDDYHMARLRGIDVDKVEEKSQIPNPKSQTGPADNTQYAIRNTSPIQNLKIRTLRPDDAAALNAMWRNPAVGKTTLQMPSQELAHAEERVNSRSPGLHRFGADVDGDLIGVISLHVSERARMSHSAGLGMMVRPDYWGQGVGSRLMEAILDLADNWLNLKRVELDVNTDNPAGIRLYEKYGFVIEGRRRFHTYGGGRWADSYFMGRVRD